MYRRFFKRTFDILFAASALVLLSPLMLIVAALIKLEDGGKFLFRQKRVGRDNTEFEVLKFRSMPEDAANLPKALAAELPVTKIGRFIRRTNIDELPQLFNILRGDMSIVGPRPPLASQEALVRMRIENGAIRCLPGLTGWAQVNAYDGIPEAEKARFDGEYADSVSFIKDVVIILRTFVFVLRKPPVY
jgi:O-antigen biosynthesis protein WbqP